MNQAQVTAYFPSDSSPLNQRLWRRGAKRFMKLAFLSDALLIEKPVSREDLLALPAKVEAESTHVIIASSLFEAPLKPASFLAPVSASTEASPQVGMAESESLLTVPSMAHWAFGPVPKMPERMEAEEKASKPFRAACIFNAEVAKPRDRSARAQSFMEFMKWELAEVFDELVMKHLLHLLCRDANTDNFWDFYDIALRSRKAELVRMSFSTNVDEQLGVASNSHLVLTDSAELAFACGALGKKVVLFGGRPLVGLTAADLGDQFLHLPDFASDAQALRALVAAEPKKKRPVPEFLSSAEASVRAALEAGRVVVQA